ncbi:MAG: VacJ family lipoprotein [Planctomycetes bacterium]|nr:VacJ family lipoprotein [Planctomycetota bacterium]
MKLKLYIPIAVWLVAVTGCATAARKNPRSGAVSPADANSPGKANFDVLEFDILEEEFSDQIIIVDPIEPWNRLMYHVNDGLYFWVLKPVSQGYKAVVPEPGRVGIRNFFHNLATPVRLVNCTLQGKFHSVGNEINRCVINTTWGVLGIWDPALDKGKIEPATEDLGQTLAVYGLDNGCYLVWPLLGPSTLRDSAGMVGDYFLNPTFYIEDDEARISISVVNVINKTSFHIGEYEDFKAAAIDPYIAMREAYIQYRQKQIQK